jgi:hypothetical protein
LSELGVFIRAGVKAINDDVTETLWLNWVGSNANKNQIDKLIKDIKKQGKKADQETIQKDWQGLQSVIGGALSNGKRPQKNN